MCFSSKDTGPPDEYEIPRLRDPDAGGTGSHTRRRASIEANLPTRPVPVPGGKKYPKDYRDDGNYYRRKDGPFQEFVTRYPDHDPSNQSRQGAYINRPGPGGTTNPGHTRAITDQSMRLQGVNYHPYGNARASVRANERYTSGPQGRPPREYTYRKDGNGARRRVRQ